MSLAFVQPGAIKSTILTVTSFWIMVYYQTFRSCLVITSLFNRMVRQLVVHDKQLRFCVFMCQNLWNEKIGRWIAQTWTHWTNRSGEHFKTACSPFRRVRDVKHLKEVLQTYWEQIDQDAINRAIGQFIRSFVATGWKSSLVHSADLCRGRVRAGGLEFR